MILVGTGEKNIYSNVRLCSEDGEGLRNGPHYKPWLFFLSVTVLHTTQPHRKVGGFTPIC